MVKATFEKNRRKQGTLLRCSKLRAVANPTTPFVGCCRPFAAAKKRSVVFKVFVGSLDPDSHRDASFLSRKKKMKKSIKTFRVFASRQPRATDCSVNFAKGSASSCWSRRRSRRNEGKPPQAYSCGAYREKLQRKAGCR